MRKILVLKSSLLLVVSLIPIFSFGQLRWQNVDSLYGPLPSSVHIYFTNTPVDTSPFRAYYFIADLKNKDLEFTTDTSRDRRLSPSAFYLRNKQPLLVVNTTFFSYETNRSLNAVIRDGELVAYNVQTVNGRGKDTFTYRHPFGSAIGISRKRKADVAWLYTDSLSGKILASQYCLPPIKDSLKYPAMLYLFEQTAVPQHKGFEKWKMQTAVGGGPVLLQDGEIKITNNEELKFAGKAIDDKHPRTAMGYTKDGRLIILMIEGRNKTASGATLKQEAQIFKDLGCWEALNLDGGGSSCMLVNGKETIKVSDATGQRPVPAVFMIKTKNLKNR
ncbi:MAG: phosphodiester glycosidase family protein [Chitinophagaceae bacterium]